MHNENKSYLLKKKFLLRGRYFKKENKKLFEVGEGQRRASQLLVFYQAI